MRTHLFLPQIRKAVPGALVAALSPRGGQGSLPGVDAEANIFPEFIFPALQPLVRDKHVGVRCTYASHIADLCHMALDFLQSVDMHRSRHVAATIEQAVNFILEFEYKFTLHY